MRQTSRTFLEMMNTKIVKSGTVRFATGFYLIFLCGLFLLFTASTAADAAAAAAAATVTATVTTDAAAAEDADAVKLLLLLKLL